MRIHKFLSAVAVVMLLGMLLAAELFTRRFGLERVLCAKLHHPATGPCIFGCGASAPALERSA